ncbi:MAG: hypothetical protein LQ345_005049, partial [Seirophora villosa]
MPWKVSATAMREAKATLRALAVGLSAERILALLTQRADNAAGSRWFPPAVEQRDKEIGFRIDAGKIQDGVLRLYLQANRSATRASVRKIPTHAKLAAYDHELARQPAGKDVLLEIIETLGERAVQGQDVSAEE